MANKKTMMEMIKQQMVDSPKMTAANIASLLTQIVEIGIPGLKRGGVVKKRQSVKKTTTKKKTKGR